MGKTAWILGGGTGIGAALAKELVERGWTVAVSGRRPGPLQALAQSHGVRPYPLDVTDADATAGVARKVAADLGRIDLMVFSVATKAVTKTAVYDHETFQKVIDTNLLGAMRVIDPVVAQMRAQGGGEIALVASVAGYFGLPRSAAYSAGKAALIALAQTMKTELARDNISVRLVSPGFVRTEFTAKNNFPMPFLLEPEDAGRRIADGLLRSRRFEIAFPLRFVLMLKLVRMLPYPLFFAIMRRLLPKG
ncbi:SDR family NAD(P)-dependent oxidoreductase [Pelagibacterium xiamenense]|uniref:SDR family NAD(P)-dependent oxidoreductase n=1 Tax=Pelagibacterium xiamenense TaxID=2901140 RepID=UPI001E337AE2|nr:SDR family NAD(P)-dependent oxidoreductase [Pelagibacterium xiamenense]MCD7060849.1 SDR family NAD(P)-dependent oxidoreductase [Pelagibacterium xiamenense]